ncbi:MAG TPA: SbcC/MukB-like Walker B domain-containing protein, partial [Actinomycetota bacterium]|nr:SbcC/MukB-like Walker B domain-containing protein [Actinomycetota bacterium]
LEGYHTAGQTLRGRVDLSLEQAETGFWLLRAATEGIRSRVSQLVRRMTDQLAVAAEELTEEERRLFDETLTGSLRAAVAERIRQANALIDGINRALASVRTDAAGVAVRLRWDVDPDQPHASRSVRALLLKDAAGYTDSERAALYEFFRGRLDQVRAELEGSSGWEERLREVLDYRRWHRFSLEVAHRDWEGFQPATTARLQRLSTGERSIALHLPMLASITAHYDGSRVAGMVGCPRLILLDELFAGVDQSNRGQLFRLFVDWDLDAIFTSDHEWCAYSTLDGIAIHQLHGGGNDGSTVSSRFVWNGRRRIAAPIGAEVVAP